VRGGNFKVHFRRVAQPRDRELRSALTLKFTACVVNEVARLLEDVVCEYSHWRFIGC
jgi:hypothetical protein